MATTIFTDYVEYETPSVINERWANEALVGMCERCGMDDCPIVVNHPNDKENRQHILMLGGTVLNADALCKWCAELDRLGLHLRLRANQSGIVVEYKKKREWNWTHWFGLLVICCLILLYCFESIFGSGW